MKLLCCTLFLLCAPTFAQAVELSEAKILLPLKGSSITAGYAKITNDSDAQVLLKIVSAKPFKAAEIHESFEANGQMGMRKVEEVKIPAHGSFELKAGGYHIMLFDSAKELREGEKIKVSFLVNGKPMTAEFLVAPRSANMEHHHH